MPGTRRAVTVRVGPRHDGGLGCDRDHDDRGRLARPPDSEAAAPAVHRGPGPALTPGPDSEAAAAGAAVRKPGKPHTAAELLLLCSAITSKALNGPGIFP